MSDVVDSPVVPDYYIELRLRRERDMLRWRTDVARLPGVSVLSAAAPGKPGELSDKLEIRSDGTVVWKGEGEPPSELVVTFRVKPLTSAAELERANARAHRRALLAVVLPVVATVGTVLIQEVFKAKTATTATDQKAAAGAAQGGGQTRTQTQTVTGSSNTVVGGDHHAAPKNAPSGK